MRPPIFNFSVFFSKCRKVSNVFQIAGCLSINSINDYVYSFVVRAALSIGQNLLQLRGVQSIKGVSELKKYIISNLFYLKRYKNYTNIFMILCLNIIYNVNKHVKI